MMPLRSRRRSLATNQTISVFLFALVLGLIFSFYQILLDLHQERKRQLEHYTFRLEQNYTAATRAAYHLNPLLAKQVAMSLMSDPAIGQVTIEDDFGDLLASETRNVRQGDKLSRWLAQHLFSNNKVYSSVLHQNGTHNQVGKLSFTVDGAAAGQAFISRARSLLMFDLVRNTLLAAILLFFFYQTISRPVMELTRWVRSLQNRTGSHALPKHIRDDEFGQLALAFQSLWSEREQTTSELNRNIEALAKSEHFTSTIMDNAHDALLLINRLGIIAHANRQASRVLGYNRYQLLGRKAVEVSVSYSVDYLQFKLQQQKGEFVLFEASHRTSDGKSYPVEVSASELEVDGEEMILLQARDISGRKQAERQIHDLAYYDSLTGLPNRKQLLDALNESLQKARRTSESGALLYLDLDRFKTINDSLGHEIGDKLLVSVARRLQKHLDPIHFCARVGGDEFVLLLPNTDYGQIPGFCQRLLDMAGAPYCIESHHLYCTMTIGIALYPNANDQPLDILRQADTALYRAKAQGSNHFLFYESEMQNQVDSYLTIEKGLHEALQQNQFELHFQPQFDGENLMTGAEALIRWRHPDQGLIPPGVFMPIAEETGQIIPIGNWIIEQACLQLAYWQNKKLLPASFRRLAINISPMQFAQPQFISQLVTSLETHGLDARMIELELTENMLLENIDDCARKMAELKRHGFAIAIDDFGTGYSSLKYLKRLALDVLKIDRSFVQNLHLEKSDEAIVDTVILMAERLQLKVIAEGVEQKPELDILRQLGCEHFQGYYFSRPLSAADMTSLLERPVVYQEE